MPAGVAHGLAYLVLVKGGRPPWAFYRAFEVLSVGDDGEEWTRVPEAPENPFVGYGGLCNGQVWALPPGTKAKRLKIRVLSGHKDTLRIPEIRVYGNAPGA